MLIHDRFSAILYIFRPTTMHVVSKRVDGRSPYSGLYGRPVPRGRIARHPAAGRVWRRTGQRAEDAPALLLSRGLAERGGKT